MVKVGRGLLKNFLELLSADDHITERTKKVGTLRRKTKGKIYESPRIVLPRQYDSFIGRRFGVYHGRANLEHGGLNNSRPSWNQEGDYILLFFPDDWKNKEKTQGVQT